MKLLAVAQIFLASLAVAEQVWPISQYENPLPTFTTREDIILTWEDGYFNPYIGVDLTPKTFTLEIAAYNKTPTGSFINHFGQIIYTWEIPTAVVIDNKALTNTLSYTWKPKLVNDWEGDDYWYFFYISWTAANGNDYLFSTKNFFLTTE